MSKEKVVTAMATTGLAPADQGKEPVGLRRGLAGALPKVKGKF